MRGKIVVVSMLIAGVVFFAYALWFFNGSSSPEARFNLSRQAIPANAPVAMLFPGLPDDFRRTKFEPEALHATYELDGDPADVTVHPLNGADAAQAIKESYILPGCTLHIHNERLMFRYSVCSVNNAVSQYEFAWINSDRLIQATSTDPEILVRFVNLYPF